MDRLEKIEQLNKEIFKLKEERNYINRKIYIKNKELEETLTKQ